MLLPSDAYVDKPTKLDQDKSFIKHLNGYLNVLKDLYCWSARYSDPRYIIVV